MILLDFRISTYGLNTILHNPITVDVPWGTYKKRNEIVGWETLGAVHANYEMFRFSSTDL